MTERFKANH